MAVLTGAVPTQRIAGRDHREVLARSTRFGQPSESATPSADRVSRNLRDAVQQYHGVQRWLAGRRSGDRQGASTSRDRGSTGNPHSLPHVEPEKPKLDAATRQQLEARRAHLNDFLTRLNRGEVGGSDTDNAIDRQRAAESWP